MQEAIQDFQQGTDEIVQNEVPALPLREYNLCQVALAAAMGYGRDVGDTRWTDEGHAVRFEQVIQDNPDLRKMALANPEDPNLIKALQLKMVH